MCLFSTDLVSIRISPRPVSCCLCMLGVYSGFVGLCTVDVDVDVYLCTWLAFTFDASGIAGRRVV